MSLQNYFFKKDLKKRQVYALLKNIVVPNYVPIPIQVV